MYRNYIRKDNYRFHRVIVMGTETFTEEIDFLQESQEIHGKEEHRTRTVKRGRDKGRKEKKKRPHSNTRRSRLAFTLHVPTGYVYAGTRQTISPEYCIQDILKNALSLSSNFTKVRFFFNRKIPGIKYETPDEYLAFMGL